MHGALTLEEGAISAIVQLATHDLPRAIAAVDTSLLQPDDFADPGLRALWTVVDARLRDGRVPDLFEVEKRVAVPRARLVRVLLPDTALPPSPGWWKSVEERLGMVRDGADRRRIGVALAGVGRMLADDSQPLEAAVAEAQRALESVQKRGGVRTAQADVLRLVDHLDEIASGRRRPVLSTGLEALDAAIGGLQPTLTVIGALPGVGKSALLAAVVRNLSARGDMCGVLSLEDEGSWLARRLVAEAATVPLFVLANRELGSNQRQRVDAAAESVHGAMAHVLIDDRPAMTTTDVIASARSMLARGAKALFVDHLGEVRLERSDRHDLDIADVLQQLRALSKTYRVPVVVFCHLKRREGLGAKDEPKLTDFAFSAAVERMSRVALALARPDDETLRVYVLKQTQGIAGVAINLPFDGPSGVVKNDPAPDTRAKAAAMYGAEEGS